MKLQKILSKDTILQVVLFLGVGVITFVIDVGATSILYNFVHTPAYLASACGFLLGFFFSFPMNRKKVFKHSKNDRYTLRTQVALYLLLCLFNLVATSVLVDVAVNGVGMWIEVAKIIVTAIIAVWNFLLFKLVIFSKL